MMTKQLSRWTPLALGVLVAIGFVRASTNHYVERRTALFQSLDEDRKRLGLSDRKEIFARYPSPEVTLCRAVRVAPGGTAEVVVEGKFAAGTHFLFENDDVDVAKENATATEYHATVRAASGAGPGYAQLHIFTPVSGGNTECTAVSIGGRYEWDFTAQNGWRIKLQPKGNANGSSDPKVALYKAEFYRGSESKPFEVLDLSLGLAGALFQNSYGGALQEPTENQAGSQGDPQAIMQKLSDPKLTDEERAKLLERMTQMTTQMMQQQQALIQKAAEQQQKQAEFGCQSMNFDATADPVEGRVTCGQKVGTLTIKGTRRFVGP
jgi:hypothetical protein